MEQQRMSVITDPLIEQENAVTMSVYFVSHDISRHMTLNDLMTATHASLLKSLYKSLRDDVLYRRQAG